MINFVKAVQVKLDKVLDVDVSTVRLPKLDASDFDRFETCLFRGDDSEVVATYGSKADAITGHDQIVRAVSFVAGTPVSD